MKENENKYPYYKVEFDEEESDIITSEITDLQNEDKKDPKIKDLQSDAKNTKEMTGGNSSFSDDFSLQTSRDMTRMGQVRQGQRFLVFLSGNIPQNFSVRCVFSFQ